MSFGTVYKPPVINATPLAAKTSRWPGIKDVRAPFLTDDSKSFGYWFNYFWEEARQVDTLSEGDKARLCDAFYAVLTKSGVGFTPVTLALVSNEKKLQILTTLLVIGFKRVALDGMLPAPGSSVQVDKAVDGGKVFLNHMQYLEKGNTNIISLGFRADGRTYDQLVLQNGLGARARSGGQTIYTDYGLDQAWHPFSLQIYANSLFLRKGINKDNCLHTVVSVSLEFAEILPYPLLSDGSLFRWANTPLTNWTTADETEALAHRFKVRAVRTQPGGAIDHLESEIRVFVLRTDNTRAFSTKNWQKKVGVTNPFPEAAVNSIPVENILAEIEVTRKHFFDNGDLTFYDFEFKKITLRPSEEVQALQFGAQFPVQLKLKLNMLEKTARSTWLTAKSRYDRIKSQSNAPTGAAGLVECPRCHKRVKKVLLNMDCSKH